MYDLMTAIGQCNVTCWLFLGIQPTLIVCPTFLTAAHFQSVHPVRLCRTELASGAAGHQGQLSNARGGAGLSRVIVGGNRISQPGTVGEASQL